MALAADDVQAIAQALQGLLAAPVDPLPAPAAGTTNAVAVKLPAFWTARPAVWFSQIEAQFATRQPPITADLTKYNYVVAALDNSTAGEVEALILNPPADNRYEILKTALIKAFGKTQAEKDNELLSLSGLGDRKPSGLLRHIRSLNADPESLLRTLFMAQLPIEVRRVLAGSANNDLDVLASDADRIMEASRADPGLSGISALKKTQHSSSASLLCFYHIKFGEAARSVA
jgi:hypothetical protein